MPIYEYVCIECDKSIEIQRSINAEEKIPPCPMCGYHMTKVYNTFGISFNGSGFYSTDKGKR